MGWQDLAVLAIVLGAVIYLVSRFVTIRRRRHRPAQTFVPIGQLKRAAPKDREGGCH
ncbi:MAG TPA: hypothetical protein VF136_08620 [Methylomirabilota bacterium]